MAPVGAGPRRHGGDWKDRRFGGERERERGTEGERKGGDEREIGQLAHSDRRGRGVEGVACASSRLWDGRGREGGRFEIAFFVVERGQQMDSSKQ